MIGVYRFWDDNGDPLYVGRSADIKRRINQHKGVAATMARSLDICECHDLAEADRVERSEITRLRPIMNQQHNPDYGFKPSPILDHGKTFIQARRAGYSGFAIIDKEPNP